MQSTDYHREDCSHHLQYVLLIGVLIFIWLSVKHPLFESSWPIFLVPQAFHDSQQCFMVRLSCSACLACSACLTCSACLLARLAGLDSLAWLAWVDDLSRSTWLAGWLTGWLAGWVAGSLACWLAELVLVEMVGWLVEPSRSSWLADWLVGCPTIHGRRLKQSLFLFCQCWSNTYEQFQSIH